MTCIPHKYFYTYLFNFHWLLLTFWLCYLFLNFSILSKILNSIHSLPNTSMHASHWLLLTLLTFLSIFQNSSIHNDIQLLLCLPLQFSLTPFDLADFFSQFVNSCWHMLNIFTQKWLIYNEALFIHTTFSIFVDFCWLFSAITNGVEIVDRNKDENGIKVICSR